jgi:Hypervirulence associated proteins TUDOR domain
VERWHDLATAAGTSALSVSIEPELSKRGESGMTDQFKVGDRVGWNSEAGRVRGTIIRIHSRDFAYKGHKRHASAEAPQYEIKSGTTDHIAAHKASALTKLSG